MTLKKSALCASALVCVSGLAVAQDRTLTYMLWSTEQVEIEAPAIAAFEAANPGVTVKVQAMPPSDYWPRVSALAASGDLPDVMAMSSGFVQEWAEAGNLLDLTPLIGEASLDGYFQSAVEIGQIDGKQVAFPQNWVAPVLYYNRTAFDAAGLDYPSADWTWDDFRAAAEALTIDTNGDGILDSVWLDLGHSPIRMSDGAMFKPLFAIRCLDLGGRLSLNAHGSPVHLIAPDNEDSRLAKSGTAAPNLRHGLGFGPADVRLTAATGDTVFEKVVLGSAAAWGWSARTGATAASVAAEPPQAKKAASTARRRSSWSSGSSGS